LILQVLGCFKNEISKKSINILRKFGQNPLSRASIGLSANWRMGKLKTKQLQGFSPKSQI
jgi:maleate cis-trans isomerase